LYPLVYFTRNIGPSGLVLLGPLYDLHM